MTTVITELPAAPARTDSQEAFSTKADAMLASLDTWTGEVNAVGTELETIANDTRDAAEAVAVIIGNSASPVSIGTGAKSFTVETGKSFAIGHEVKISNNATPTTKFMRGVVTGYTAGTGALDITVDVAVGSGTLSAWTITITTDSVSFEQAHAFALLF